MRHYVPSGLENIRHLGSIIIYPAALKILAKHILIFDCLSVTLTYKCVNSLAFASKYITYYFSEGRRCHVFNWCHVWR